jgi:hypothetical protein
MIRIAVTEATYRGNRTRSDVRKFPLNSEQLGRIFEEHMREGLVIDDQPPLSPDERRRRIVQLCCSFLRNLAFHRAGLDTEVERKLLDPRHPQAAFWREVRGNFFDISVLEWCKLFAEGKKGKHHWRRVVDNPDRFEADLYTTLGVTAAEFTTLITKIKDYRDKFVAHLDEERTMLLPALEVARRAIVFLHERLVQQAGAGGDWSNLPTSREELDAQASREAQSVYTETLARLAETNRRREFGQTQTMKALKGEEIVCDCAQPAGSFRDDVEDRASISSKNIAITLPGVPGDHGRWVCPVCHTTVACFISDRWRVRTINGWLE